MPKNKLKKYAEVRTFPNFIDLPPDIVKQGVPYKGQWKQKIFKNSAPLFLELGCGKGEFTTGLASRFPQNNYLGIDIKGARLWHGCKTAIDQNLKNAAFIRTRIDLLEYIFDRNEVNGIWLTFPDPQPKKENKRLTSPEFLNRYSMVMKPGATIKLKTDNSDLFNYSLEVIHRLNCKLVSHTYDLYASDRAFLAAEIQTYYEGKYIREGKKIKYLEFQLAADQKTEKESFFQKVYEVVRLIPHGRVTSYGAIAEYLGSRGSARMVGWAMNKSHFQSVDVPAHRVVNRTGLLTGKHHFGTPDTMKQLLESEGIKVKDDQIVDFKEKFWDPSGEL